jgi:predicted RNase H-like HicB family nuclease
MARDPRTWRIQLVRVPDLPEAAAKTREETGKLIREAIALHLELMREDGDPIPVPSTEATKVAV